MSRPGGSIVVAPLTAPDVHAIAQWRYEPPYDFYDGDEQEIAVMLDPANNYYSVGRDRELVGYLCIGPDARVAGQAPIDDADDLGWGFRPDLIGRGIASRWIPVALARVDEQLTKRWQRVTVISWNQRSQAAARRMGFERSGTHHNAHGDWVVMCRLRPRGLSN